MQFPDIFWAVRITDSNLAQYTAMRDELQARILANQHSTQIARRIPIPYTAIDRYESFFYDVRSRLKFPSYIMHHVIGPTVHKGLQSKDYGVLWRLFGYHTGPVVLDMLVDTFNSRARPDSPDTMPAFTREVTTDDFMRHAMIVSKTFNVNAFSQRDILEFFLQLTQIEKKGEGGQTGQNSILKNVELMMVSLGKVYQVGPDVDGAPTLNYDKHTAELRSSELIKISAGLMPEAIPAEVALLEYPKPAPVLQVGAEK